MTVSREQNDHPLLPLIDRVAGTARLAKGKL
jgi:hypothetical protein